MTDLRTTMDTGTSTGADVSSNRGCAIALLVVSAMLIVGTLNGMYIGRSIIRQEACEAGVAHYVVDPKTGKTTFEWKTSK